jgi:hypothetical protein
MLYRFHVNVFARPSSVQKGETIDLRGVHVPSLRATAFDAFLPVTFEAAILALTKLPRVDAEPDGFFVISGDAEGARWQIDGHLFDFGDRLHRVELHGECPPRALDEVLRCFHWPATPLVFELVKEGVAVDEPSFRAWASA